MSDFKRYTGVSFNDSIGVPCNIEEANDNQQLLVRLSMCRGSMLLDQKQADVLSQLLRNFVNTGNLEEATK